MRSSVFVIAILVVAACGKSQPARAPTPPLAFADAPTLAALDAGIPEPTRPVGNRRLVAYRNALLVPHRLVTEYRARVGRVDLSASLDDAVVTFFLADRFVRELVPRRMWETLRDSRAPYEALIGLMPIVDAASAQVARAKLVAASAAIDKAARDASAKADRSAEPLRRIADATTGYIARAIAVLDDAIRGGDNVADLIAAHVWDNSIDYGLDLQLSTVELFEEAALLWRAPLAPLPVVASTGPIVQVGAGSNFTCALRRTGTVACWGVNNQGQLGDGSTQTRTKPVSVIGVGDAVQIAVGEFHACALIRDGSARCWGRGTTRDMTKDVARPRAVAVTGLRDAKQIAAGMDLTCAVAGNARVWCWGVFDQWGADWVWPPVFGEAELYGNRYWRAYAPREIPELAGATRVVIGSSMVCAQFADQSVKCTGTSFIPLTNGVLDIAATTYTPGPGAGGCLLSPRGYLRCTGGEALGDVGAVRVTAADYAHGCVLSDRGEVRCWGDAKSGLCTAKCAAALPPLAALAIGDTHACGLARDGRVLCWGNNEDGQSAQGDAFTVEAPTLVPL